MTHSGSHLLPRQRTRSAIGLEIACPTTIITIQEFRDHDDSRYNSETNASGTPGRSLIEFTFEVRETTGPEGHQLNLAQARALRRALEWAAAHDQQTRQAQPPGGGEENPRTA